MPSARQAKTRQENRSDRRFEVNSLALVSAGDRARTTRLFNISAGGALVGPVFGVSVGDKADITLPGYGVLSGRIVRITDENRAAICFSPDPDFRHLCETKPAALQSMITESHIEIQRPYKTARRILN